MLKTIAIGVCCSVSLSSCSKLPISRHAEANVFNYQAGQPSIHFNNKGLNVQGAWWWGSSARAMPDPNFLPKEIRKLIRPMSKQHGKVLFATFSKDQKKFLKNSGYVPVFKRDVRAQNPYSTDCYIAVLISNSPFSDSGSAYLAKGRANDFEFSLFEKPPVRKGKKWLIMEVIAAYKDKYLTMACVIDQNLAKSDAQLKYQRDLFFEDTKLYLAELEP